jgi:hypothetical protein
MVCVGSTAGPAVDVGGPPASNSPHHLFDAQTSLGILISRGLLILGKLQPSVLKVTASFVESLNANLKIARHEKTTNGQD